MQYASLLNLHAGIFKDRLTETYVTYCTRNERSGFRTGIWKLMRPVSGVKRGDVTFAVKGRMLFTH
jgi:hypothetical protein